MKQIISIGVGLFMAGSVMASTMTHKTVRMLPGTMLCVSNSTLVRWDTTNVWYYNYAAGTNVLAGTTNAAGLFYPLATQYGGLWPDMNADVSPNVSLQVILGYTNNLFTTAGQSPQFLNTVWTNPTAVFTNATTQTNTLTVNLYTVDSLEFGLPCSTNWSKMFSYAVTNINNVPTIASTNLPTSFLQGAAAVAASVSAGAGTGTGQGIIVNGLNLTGWSP